MEFQEVEVNPWLLRFVFDRKQLLDKKFIFFG